MDACGEVWAGDPFAGAVGRRYRIELWVEGVQGGRRRGSSRGRGVLLRSPRGLGGWAALQLGFPGCVTLRKFHALSEPENRGQTHPPHRDDAKLGRGCREGGRDPWRARVPGQPIL